MGAPFDIVIGSSDIRTYINGSITGHLEDRDDVTFNTSQYCIAFTDAFNSEESDNVKTSYFVCVNFGEAVEETKSVYIFYPISIFISWIFLLCVPWLHHPTYMDSLLLLDQCNGHQHHKK